MYPIHYHAAPGPTHRRHSGLHSPHTTASLSNHLHQTYNHPILSFPFVLFSSGASLLIVVFQEAKPADSVDGKWTEEQEVKVQKRPLTAQNGAAPMAKSDSGVMRNGRSLRENGAKSQSQEVTSSGGDSPDDHEKDERRRATQRVFLKQG